MFVLSLSPSPHPIATSSRPRPWPHRPSTSPSSTLRTPLDRYLTHPGATTSQLVHHLEQLATTAAPWAGSVGAAAIAVVVVSLVWRRRTLARAMNGGARLVQILTPPQVEPGSAQAFWSNLMALLRPPAARLLRGQPHLAFELTATPAGLQVGLWVPGTVPPEMVERAVHAAWPGARTTTTPATPPLRPIPGTSETGGQLRLAAPECYPLRTEHPADPLRPLIGALADLGPGEAACVQVLARPVTGRRIGRLHRAAVGRRTGTPTTTGAKALELLSPGNARRPAESDPERSGDVAAILGKAAQPCWAVAIRYAVTTTTTTTSSRTATGAGARRREQAAAARRLRGRAHGIASGFALFTGRNSLRRSKLRHPVEVLNGRRLGHGQLLSVPELAAVAHLPGDVAVPGLTRAGARAVPPPPQVGATGKLLGDGEGTAARPVALAVPDARQHVHVLGATGSGKSTLLTNLILSDITAGRGVVVIDPKGDLIVDVLDRIPAEAAGRVVLIDPDESDATPIMNVLDGADPDLTVDNLVGIFATIFARFWGPRTDDVLRSACLTLLAYAQRTKAYNATLADVPRLLADPAFRATAIAGLDRDTAGLRGFWTWYDGMGDAARAQAVGPLLNKLRAFMLRDFVRSIVGSGASSFNMADVLDGGICLVRVSKGILGEETSRLLGSFVVARVWQAAAHRARLGQAVRVDAALYVDECQNFLTMPRSFDEMLAEARGYRLSLVLAHQHLGQLPRELREAVSANARSKVFFSVSPEDARALERHVAPELTAHDLAHLPAYTAAARLLVDGEETAAFTLRTRPAPATGTERDRAKVRALARAAHGRSQQQRTEAALPGRPGPEAGGVATDPRTAPDAAADREPPRRADERADDRAPFHAATRSSPTTQVEGQSGWAPGTADSVGEWE